jgi:RNA polymerase sigma-70 factor, ECF subfamily
MQSLAAPRMPTHVGLLPPRPPPELTDVPPWTGTRSGIFPVTSTQRPSPRRPASAVLDTSTDDASLVKAACRGDARAHAIIWRKYAGLVRCKVGLLAGGRDVDDHIQEVFVRLFGRLAELRDPSALRSFIIGIALRVVGTELRRRRCRPWLTLTASGDLPEVPRPWADDGSDAREMVARFAAIVDRLTPHSARIFALRYVEEMELVEVAQAMNISLATVKRHLARASARVFAMAENDPALAGFVRGATLTAYDVAS